MFYKKLCEASANSFLCGYILRHGHVRNHTAEKGVNRGFAEGYLIIESTKLVPVNLI